jgi:DNA-binding response OmpR family regulator
VRLLLAEDDAELAAHLMERLRANGYAVDHASNGVDAQHLGSVESYDAVVLDIGLPQRSGTQVLLAWRAERNAVPVLILTARSEWEQKVEGFRAGADDYLTKPFHTEELVARIGALIRRANQPLGVVLEAHGFSLDEEKQTVVAANGAITPLTGTEFRLLRYFMTHPNKVLSKSRLAEHVYELDDDRDSNVIEVYVTRLRRKLGAGVIETRRGQGYVLTTRGDESASIRSPGA